MSRVISPISTSQGQNGKSETVSFRPSSPAAASPTIHSRSTASFTHRTPSVARPLPRALGSSPVAVASRARGHTSSACQHDRDEQPAGPVPRPLHGAQRHTAHHRRGHWRAALPLVPVGALAALLGRPGHDQPVAQRRRKSPGALRCAGRQGRDPVSVDRAGSVPTSRLPGMFLDLLSVRACCHAFCRFAVTAVTASTTQSGNVDRLRVHDRSRSPSSSSSTFASPPYYAKSPSSRPTTRDAPAREAPSATPAATRSSRPSATRTACCSTSTRCSGRCWS